MKIVFDYQIFASQQYGGISRYFMKLAEHVTQNRNLSANVKILAPLHKNEFLIKSKNQINLFSLGHRTTPRSRRLTRFLNGFISTVALKILRPDIIHETYYSESGLHSSSAKRVITVYDMIHELLPEHFSKDDTTSDLKRSAVNRADHVICISENTRNDLIRILQIDRAKTSVIHLGFSLECAEATKISNHPKPFILYVGARGGYKNFHNLVMAYGTSPKFISNFDLICFGGGSFSSNELESFTKLRIPRSSIRQVSGGDELLASYYSSASVFVYPSLYEGFGIPPLEAMSFKCPVACSNTSSLPEVVGDAAALFDPYSVESITESLEQVLWNLDLRLKLIEKGGQRIQQFSWEKCALETVSVYESVVQ